MADRFVHDRRIVGRFGQYERTLEHGLGVPGQAKIRSAASSGSW